MARPALLALLLIPSLLSGQTVHGIVSEQGSNAPVRGAFVSLIDSTGSRQRGYLTDEAGRYIMLAPAPGSWRLQIERLGYESIITDTFTLAALEARSIPLVLPISALRLPELTVSRDQRCVSNPQRARETARVWEEVRKALNVAVWLQKGGQARFRVCTFEQDLSAELDPIGAERMAFGLFEGQAAFYSAPADSLERGFVQREGDSTVFFGPDAELMMRPEFLDRHCFRLQRVPERPGLLGLAFEPARGQRLPDIKGALWLDEKTGALRHLDYEFTNLGLRVDARYAGGRTAFEQLPNGAWIVRNWTLITPSVQRVSTRRNVVRVTGATRHGGEVFGVVLGDSVQDPALGVTITGWLRDSLRAQPIADARITLPATSFETRTNSSGAFVLTDVPRGEYYILAEHPRLDSIPSLPPLLRFHADSSTLLVTLATPDRETLFTQLCGARDLASLKRRVRADRLGAIRLEVEHDTTPLRFADVRLHLQDDRRLFRRQAKTDARGQAVICADLGTGQFHIEVKIDDRFVRVGSAILPPERILRLGFRVTGSQQ